MAFNRTSKDVVGDETMTCDHPDIRLVNEKHKIYQCEYCGELLNVYKHTKPIQAPPATAYAICVHCMAFIEAGDGIVSPMDPDHHSHLECYLDCKECNPE